MNIKKINEFKQEDLEPTKSFIIKDHLNPDVWDDYRIKPDIREKLQDISDEFMEKVHGDYTIYDVVLTGSLSSYNWSQYSDFDIHVIIDYSDINEDVELVEHYLDLLGKRFNKDYNITIHGYDVELYIEDKDSDKDHVNGIFSIMKNKWIKKPESNDNLVVDEKLVEKKTILIMEQIDDIINGYDSNDVEDVQKQVNELWDKIKKARRDGINSPEGEYAIGNLVFKYLRRNGYIGKMIQLKKDLVEDKYSI